MIISEKQIMMLIRYAQDYVNTMAIMINKNMAGGNAKELMLTIDNLLREIENQQSEELKKIE